MKFAKRVFTVAAIYGLVLLIPQYFTEGRVGRDFPPPITHPEYYYGFIGVAAAWQVLFLILAKDPVRFRPMIVPGILEKLGFGLASVLLYLKARVPPVGLAFGLMDLVFAVLFFTAYRKLEGLVASEQGSEPRSQSSHPSRHS